MFNALYFKTFISLVETGSFTLTARRLEMTQPAVSQQVRKLEQYFGLPLLMRQGRSFELTPAGRQVYDYALRLFAEHDQFRHRLEQDLAEGGECRFICPELVGELFYPFTLGYMKNYPRLKLDLRFANNAQAAQEVLQRKSDVALVSEFTKHADLQLQEYMQEPLILVVPADFQGNKLQDLLSLGFIEHEQGAQLLSSVLRANFPEEFRGQRQVTQRVFINQMHLVLDAVARGLGFTVVPRSIWEASTWQQLTREWRLATEVEWSIYLVHHRKQSISERSRYLLDEYLLWRAGHQPHGVKDGE
ncbi:LysR family transcriptional regulator [Marinospirillum sp. MEB164]|uniref:LysR family transcriptional regulator n=1 Tax=Marinospirillum alkalitolerans TaxID=3123374 RepID=A0ABW8PW83_9GAMM